ncbi:MAG: VgrG-related protein [Chloroflexota bacterium]|nr:VgrG-related protein [Chloroflexota bacterium]
MPDNDSMQWYIKLNGSELPAEVMNCLTRVTVESSMNIPAVATLHLHSLPLGHSTALDWIDSPKFDPGTAMEVSVKHGSQTTKIFDGEVVELEPFFGPVGCDLVIRAFDMLHRLSRGRKVTSYREMTDKDIMSQIVSKHGLSFNYGANSPGQVHPYVLQNSQTDLDFVRSRAVLVGCHIFAAGKTIHCAAPASGSAALVLEGNSLASFRPRLTTIDQVANVTVRGWDQVKKTEIVGQYNAGSVSGAVMIDGKNGSKFAASAHNGGQDHFVTDWNVVNQDEAQKIAETIAKSACGKFVQAEGVSVGAPAIVAGASIQIRGVGTRFSGTFFVTNALHTYDAKSGYDTEFTISGYDPTTLLQLLAKESNDAAKTGLQIGIVTEVDPKKAEVKLQFPHLGAEAVTNWVRVAAPGAGSNRGFQFLPEVNDEVVVGFERGDASCPFVIGGLWNGKDTAPSQEALKSQKVASRVIQSRSGHVITFDDDEAGGGITIKDKAGETITLNAKEKSITIESTKDIIVKATGDLTMSGVNLSLQGQKGVEIKGPQVKINGDAQVEIKGGMIKLN